MLNEPRRSVPSFRLLVISTVLSLLVAVVAIGGYFFAGPMVKSRILAEARARGVELAFNDVHFWWWSASLEGVRFRLTGVAGLEGQASSIDVALANFDPTSIIASDVTVSVQGSAIDLALSVGEWTKNHPQAYSLPLSANDLAVSFSESATTTPWLVVKGGTLNHTPAGVTFSAPAARVSGIDVGTVGASWSTSGAKVALGFGTTDPKAAPVTASVLTGATPPTATIALAPTDLSKLAGPLGVKLPVRGVVASGTAVLVFPVGMQSGRVTGHIDARLDGFVPPHPVELDGFLFGSTTLFSTDLNVSADRLSVDLTRTHVAAGAFVLDGDGHVTRFGGGPALSSQGAGVTSAGPSAYAATIVMSLAGNLPCAAVVQSAAAAHVDTLLARLAGNAARQVLGGSLSVNLRITADTRDLAGARVTPTISVGCGIGPLENQGAKFVGSLPGRVLDLARSLGIPGIGTGASAN